jgi:addiction module HigA family antidote
MNKKLVPITPGEILLEEFMKPFSINQRQLAKCINVPANRISQIIHGSREITSDTALRLGKFFGIEPEFWLNLQMRYNLKITKNSVWGKINSSVTTIKNHYLNSSLRPST